MMKRDDDNDLSYGALMMLCEGHGTSKIYERIQAALAAKDQQVQAWQMAYEGVQRQLAAKDQELAVLRTASQLASFILEHPDGDYDKPDQMQAEAEQYGLEKLFELKQSHAELQQQLDTLLAEAVWAMERYSASLVSIWCDIYDAHKEDEAVQSALSKDEGYQRAQAFLARPDVQAWRKGKQS